MFEYDVFLSYSHKDKNIVYDLASRLKQDGIRVWLDDWVIRPGDSIPIKIQHGLEKSHTLLMCMSPAYFGSEWGMLEHHTILFRDPTNMHRRLIPLLIVDCTRPDIIAHLKYIDWRNSSDESYDKILASCQKNDSELFSTLSSGVQLSIPKTFTSPSTGIEFVLIPAGKFIMGSLSNTNKRGRHINAPVHEVIIKNSFYMGKYQVTQNQWKTIMSNNPSHFKGDNLPVEKVSWNDAQEFIKNLNKMGKTNKYRLPSEAEWEYACRAGTTTAYSFGDDESKLEDYGWYSGYTDIDEWEKNEDKILEGKTHPVGQKKPNQWDLYDMHGNVLEWCQDRWHNNYFGAPFDGNAWEKGRGSVRVSRGGSWYSPAGNCRSTTRFKRETLTFFPDNGFRVVRDI